MKIKKGVANKKYVWKNNKILYDRIKRIMPVLQNTGCYVQGPDPMRIAEQYNGMRITNTIK